jgi:ketosteroid isomerase-like protein
MRATAKVDLETVFSLIAEDAVFLLPDQPPMRGREAFAGALRSALGQVRIEGKPDIQEFTSLETTPFAGISFL